MAPPVQMSNSTVKDPQYFVDQLSKIDHPDVLRRPTVFDIKDVTSPEHIRKHADEIEEYNSKKELYEAEKDLAESKEAKIDREFVSWALDDTGLSGHPKAEKAWNMAYERGHSHGYSEIHSELQDLAELLLD